METTLLRIAYVRTFNYSSEHMLNVLKHLFLHFGVSVAQVENGYLYLKVRVPCGDGVDALVEWERAQDIVNDAYVRVRKMILPREERLIPGLLPEIDSDSIDLRWIPCKHR
jgi:hypothetical protein